MTGGPELFEVLGQFPAEPDTDHAAEAAEQEIDEKTATKPFAQRPESVTEDHHAGEDAELVHAGQAATENFYTPDANAAAND